MLSEEQRLQECGPTGQWVEWARTRLFKEEGAGPAATLQVSISDLNLKSSATGSRRISIGRGGDLGPLPLVLDHLNRLYQAEKSQWLATGSCVAR